MNKKNEQFSLHCYLIDEKVKNYKRHLKNQNRRYI